ncbi:MAG: PadR family transcriptional regulator [Dactylosporangium sp.]|nr:PadR family transcriptional regulator [Dactylosporangium sp.]NNJ60021.1 PadR family transcriptional regulator [Dactylosporangium sp.]
MEGAGGLSTSLRRGTLEFCVLALMERGDQYGTELVRQLGAERNLAISEGTIYPLLSRLRRSGWVETTWRESPSGPPRRYYSLTPSGSSVLQHFRREWAVFRDTVDRIVGTDSP